MEITIDVLVIIDSETILSTLPHGSVDNPTHVPNSPELIFMVTKQANALSGQAGNELNISAETQDTIRWRATTLSLNSDSEVILYKFIATSGADLMSNPEPFLADVTVPLPNPTDPTSPQKQGIKSYFFNSVILSPGSVTYRFYFVIFDRHGNPQGYFFWDPFITISNLAAPEVINPIANFSANITQGDAPLAVLFTSKATGNPTDYYWVFEPSTSSDWNSHHAVTAVHTFKKPGTYTISLTVTNDAGSTTVTRTEYITVR